MFVKLSTYGEHYININNISYITIADGIEDKNIITMTSVEDVDGFTKAEEFWVCSDELRLILNENVIH